jgi:hypothetical protein
VPVEILSLAESVKRNFVEEIKDKTIMARKPHMAFYLDMDFEVIPFVSNSDELIEKLMNSKSDYLYVSEWECRILSAELCKLFLNYQNPLPILEVVIYNADPLAIIYKIKKK